jgi:hypothetical protein
MTAAMAFFSIALTLNLAGIRLDQLHARDLNPTHVKQTYYEASAEAVRYYDNLRVVRVLESRVDDLRATNGDDVEPKQPETQPATQQSTPEPHPVSPEPKQSAPGSHPADAPKKGSGGVSVARPPMEQLRLLPVTWHGRMLRVSGGAA